MFIVIKVIDNRHVKVADGDLRKIEKAKIKNIKHIHLTNIKLDEVVDHIVKGETPDNHVIRKSLKRIREAGEIDGKEVW
jgi:ribosomal protein L14E/L6E/L27E